MQLVTLDFETYWAKDYSLSNKGMFTQRYIMCDRFKAHGCGVKIGDGPARWVTAKHLPAVFRSIDWDNTMLCGHNLAFDGAILAWRYGHQPAMYLDTLALARAQLGANLRRHNLESVGQQLLGHGKSEGLYATRGVRDLPPEMEATLGRYCVNDVELAYQILPKLLKGMTHNELKAMDWTIRTFCNPRFCLDVAALTEYLAELEQQKADALASVGMEDRETLNSSAKFADALETLGATVPMKESPKRKNEDGAPVMVYAFAKTDPGLKALLDHPNPKVQALVAARLEIKSTNEENKTTAYLESAKYGAWPVSLKYAGAMNTQRFSGDSGGGGNPQNLGRTSRIRRAIKAPPGYKIIAADLSQIECRVTLQLAAYYYLWNKSIGQPADCQELRSLQILREGGDIYCWFGSMIYGRDITKADKQERQTSKAAVLGLGFGMGWSRFVDHCAQNGVPMDEVMAKRIVNLYRKTFPNVVRMWKASLQQLADILNEVCIPALRYKIDPNGGANAANAFNILTPCRDPFFNEPALRMPNGQHLKYPGLTCVQTGNRSEWSYMNRGKKTFLHPGKCAENHVQALAGMFMRDMLVKIQDALRTAEFPEQNIGVELSVHDELVCLVYDTPKWLAWTRDLLGRVMQTAPACMPELPVACEIKEGYTYAECH